MRRSVVALILLFYASFYELYHIGHIIVKYHSLWGYVIVFFVIVTCRILRKEERGRVNSFIFTFVWKNY